MWLGWWSVTQLLLKLPTGTGTITFYIYQTQIAELYYHSGPAVQPAYSLCNHPTAYVEMQYLLVRPN